MSQDEIVNVHRKQVRADASPTVGKRWLEYLTDMFILNANAKSLPITGDDINF